MPLLSLESSCLWMTWRWCACYFCHQAVKRVLSSSREKQRRLRGWQWGRRRKRTALAQKEHHKRMRKWRAMCRRSVSRQLSTKTKTSTKNLTGFVWLRLPTCIFFILSIHLERSKIQRENLMHTLPFERKNSNLRNYLLMTIFILVILLS